MSDVTEPSRRAVEQALLVLLWIARERLSDAETMATPIEDGTLDGVDPEAASSATQRAEALLGSASALLGRDGWFNCNVSVLKDTLDSVERALKHAVVARERADKYRLASHFTGQSFERLEAKRRPWKRVATSARKDVHRAIHFLADHMRIT